MGVVWWGVYMAVLDNVGFARDRWTTYHCEFILPDGTKCDKPCLNEYNLRVHQLSRKHTKEDQVKSSSGSTGNTGVEIASPIGEQKVTT